MSPVHALGQFNPSLRISNRSLERVNRTKLLGIHFSEHLYWVEHVHNLSKSCYSVLGILRKIKKLKTYLTITIQKLKLSRPVWLGTRWIIRCEYRREGAYFFLSFVLLLSVLSKLKRTLEKHKVTASSSAEWDLPTIALLSPFSIARILKLLGQITSMVSVKYFWNQYF